MSLVDKSCTSKVVAVLAVVAAVGADVDMAPSHCNDGYIVVVVVMVGAPVGEALGAPGAPLAVGTILPVGLREKLLRCCYHKLLLLLVPVFLWLW